MTALPGSMNAFTSLRIPISPDGTRPARSKATPGMSRRFLARLEIVEVRSEPCGPGVDRVAGAVIK